MSKTINVVVKDKIAATVDNTVYVCGNSDFVIVFDFDEEWEEHIHKTARFVWNGMHQDIVFSGNECEVPVMSNTHNFMVGVFAGDLATTTPAYVPATKSILCGTTPPAPPPPDVYEQMVALFQSGLDEGRVNANRAEEAASTVDQSFTMIHRERLRAEEAAVKAESAQSASETIAKDVEQAKSDAVEAKNAAKKAQGDAEYAKAGADEAVKAAIKSADEAKMHNVNASNFDDSARTSAIHAKNYANSAAASAEEAKTKAAIAQNAAETASNAAKEAVDEYMKDYHPGSGGPVLSVNGKAGAVVLNAADVGARPSTWTPTATEVGALPNTTKIPDKTSELTNDSGFITGYTETDPTVPAWAKAATKPSYTKAEVGLGSVDNVKQYSASNPPPYPVRSVNGKTGAVSLSASDVGAVGNDQLPNVINSALQQAKESGEFDGKDAEFFVVNLIADDSNADDIKYYADKTSLEIYEAWENGQPILCAFNFSGVRGTLSPMLVSNTLVQFVGVGKYFNSYVTTVIGAIIEGSAVTPIIDQLSTMDDVYQALNQALEQAIEKGIIPTKTSDLTNDSGFITGYTETDPTVPSWAKAATKPSYTKSEVGLGSVDNVRQYSANNPPPYPVSSVNGKTGAVNLVADDVGARPSTWTPTYSDVGAEKSGTSASAVSTHNTGTDAHNDIRLLIAALTNRLDALANSDDETLDQMAEVVAYIKANRDLIEQITTGKVSYTDIVNNLTTNVTDKPLSAAQGVALKALIDAITVPTKLSQLTNDKGYITGFTETDPTVPDWAKASTKPSYTKNEVGLGNVDNVKQYSASNPPPYPVASVNGKTGAVTLDASAVGARPSTWMPTASDVGARPSTWTPTAANVGAVPTSRKVNGKALSADITLSAADVGAVPSTNTLTVTGVDANGVTHTWTMYGVSV